MQVLKFGGSSVATADAIKKVGAILQKQIQAGKTIVVVSALGKVTDELQQCATLAAHGDNSFKELLQKITQRHLDVIRALLPVTNQSALLSKVVQQFNEVEDICNGVFLLREISARTNDRILSYGELLSSQIVSAYLLTIQLPNQWIDARTLIITDSHFTKAAVDFNTTNKKIQEAVSISQSDLFIVPGFISADANGSTTTLGRGGSDYTAAIIAAALNAAQLQIWTDVSGMMTADPRLANHAKPISNISYQEAMELSHFGAKVIYPPTLQPVMQLEIPVRILNTFSPEDHGTTIEKLVAHTNGIIRGISSINNVALLSLEGSGMVGIPGFSKRLFEALAFGGINVILITQASSEHSICVGVEEADAAKAKKLLDKTFAYEISRQLLNPLAVEKTQAIVALVGDNMKSHTGTSGKMFGALGKNGINIRAIAQGSSERNISAVIAATDVKKAINVLHEEFFEATYKQLNLFVAGTGNVGSKLLAQINKQQKYLLKNMKLQLKVIGIANSRKMLFNDKGIDLSNDDKMKDAEVMNLDEFIRITASKNLRNSLFIDVTASDLVAGKYASLFEKSISVVACNKIACSSVFSNYKKLKTLANEHNASFLFETNVGAGLPVINTLNDLLRSGDKIAEIHAVLSGTLNFVFNNYNSEKSFA
ncbi:MAG: bifunctional aspartate kinase/homoserine dehydrogenase I, partial [Bacteroidota bacterium]